MTTATALSTPPRLLAGVARAGGPGLDAHLRVWGPLPACDGAEVVTRVEESGLTGRGGAGFPVARKMRAVLAAGGRAVVVANGAEGEPASAKDRVLLELAPQLVLDGIQLAARAVRAEGAFLVVHAGSRLVGHLRAALLAREDRVPVQVLELPTAYVASEASAVVHWLNGGEATPTFTPPRAAQSGVRGRPTLVNNVETLAHVAMIARRGAAWFRGVGDPAQPGTMLLTLSAAGLDRGVVEVATGERLGDVLADAGIALDGAAALLVGGYAGGWLPPDVAADVPLSTGALRALGGSLGAGVVVALPPEHCGVLETARVAAYLAAHSAGQCGPCRNGLPAIAGVLRQLAVGPWDDCAWPPLQHWLRQVPRRGACGLPDGAVTFCTSALSVFAADVAEHRRGRPCGAVANRPFLLLPPIASTPTWR